MEQQEDVVVVPLVPMTSEPSTEMMLRMLLDREALVITRTALVPADSGSGLVAQSAGAFAKAINQAAGNFGRSAPTEGLFRVIMPTGSVARDLVPAVGGGFRSMVRGAGSTKFAAQARFVPVAAGAGATMAAGPLIATIGLAVAAEMLAQHQTNQKLNSIKSVVLDLQTRSNDQDRSILSTAAQQTRKVAGYLLDQAHIPSISSAAHAFGDLDTLANVYVDRLDRWLEVAHGYANADRVYGPQLLERLVGKRDNPIQEFERLVAQTYEALAIRARVVVLEKVAAEFANPERSLLHVEQVVRGELAVIADRQRQLVGLMDDLSVMQIDSSKVPVTFAGKRTLGARTTFSKLARALHVTPDGLPVLTESDQTVLELAPSAGGLSIMSPKD